MVDTVTKPPPITMGNDNDDWEVAVDTGEFDKRHEQEEKARASKQESTPPVIVDDDSRNNTSFNIMNLNKPIRILKRPTSQSHLSTNNDVPHSSIAPSHSTNSATITSSDNDNNTNDCNSSSSYNSSSSTTVPVVSIIPRNQTKDSVNSSESIATPAFPSTMSSSQSTKPAIKTYEQRELEYRLARLRIMGEEESSAKDDDDNDTPTVEPISLSTDDNIKVTLPPNIRSTNKMNGFSQVPLQCHSTPSSYASDLYTLNNVPSNTGTIHFTPNNNPNNNSTPNLGTAPFSSSNFPQHYRNTYTGPYSHLLPNPPGVPRYPIPATTTTTLYMTSTAPFISAPSSSVSSSYHYPLPQHPNMPTNNWYHYQRPQMPYGAQQYGHPQ